MVSGEERAVPFGIGCVGDGAADGQRGRRGGGRRRRRRKGRRRRRIVKSAGVAAGNREAPPPTRLGAVPLVRGVDASVGSVRECGACHVGVTGIDDGFPCVADGAGTGDRCTSE